MKKKNNNIDTKKAETSQDNQNKQPADGVNPQLRERQARKQQ